MDVVGSFVVKRREQVSSLGNLRRSFWDGWLDLFGANTSRTQEILAQSSEDAMRMDAEAIASDWAVVGADMRAAMRAEKVRAGEARTAAG